MLVHIVLARIDHMRIEHPPDTWLFSYSAEAFAKNNQLVARDVVFLDCLANDLLRHAIGVYIGCVPCV